MVQKLGSSQLHQQFSLSLLSEKHEELIGKPSSESDIYKLRARLATSIELSFTVSKCSASQKSKACLGPPGAYLGSGNNFIQHKKTAGCYCDQVWHVPRGWQFTGQYHHYVGFASLLHGCIIQDSEMKLSTQNCTCSIHSSTTAVSQSFYICIQHLIHIAIIHVPCYIAALAFCQFHISHLCQVPQDKRACKTYKKWGFLPWMATHDVTSISRQVPGEEQLMWRKAVGNGIPPGIPHTSC